MRKPKPQAHGAVRVRVIDGPREGEWRWRAERYVDGRAVSVWSGWATLDEVRDPDGRVAEAIRLGLDGARAKDRALAGEAFPDDPTLHDLLEFWAAHVEELGKPGPSGRAEYAQNTVHMHTYNASRLDRFAGDTKLTRVTPEWLDRLKARLLGQYASGTVSGTLISLRLALEWGRSVGLEIPHVVIPTIPWEPVRKGRTPTTEEVEQVYLKMVPVVGWEKVAYRLIWATGARSADLVAMRGRHVDTERRRLQIPDTTKTGSRAVFVTPEVMAELAALGPWEADEPVFGITDADHFRAYLQAAVDLACDQLKINRWTSHAFRRHAIRSARRKGEDVLVTAAAMGNTPTTIWKHYDEADEEDVKRAAERMQLGALPEGVVALPSGAKKGRTRKQWRRDRAD